MGLKNSAGGAVSSTESPDVNSDCGCWASHDAEKLSPAARLFMFARLKQKHLNRLCRLKKHWTSISTAHKSARTVNLRHPAAISKNQEWSQRAGLWFWSHISWGWFTDAGRNMILETKNNSEQTTLFDFTSASGSAAFPAHATNATNTTNIKNTTNSSCRENTEWAGLLKETGSVRRIKHRRAQSLVQFFQLCASLCPLPLLNSLPTHIQNCSDSWNFKSPLKTDLFNLWLHCCFYSVWITSLDVCILSFEKGYKNKIY